MNKKEEQQEMKTTDIRYTKEQILQAERFMQVQKDLIHGILQEDKSYTINEVQHMIEQFLKQEAK